MRHLAADGVREFNLIAEDTNQYGMDRKDGKSLASLLHEMAGIEGVEWIRILYAYPSYFTDDLIAAIADIPQVCVCVCVCVLCVCVWHALLSQRGG